MTSSKSSYHHGDLRNALVDAGLRLIEQVGAEAFSLREVAREVGVSANAAYRHFEDKGALLTAIAVAGFERLSSDMHDAMLAAGPDVGGPGLRGPGAVVGGGPGLQGPVPGGAATRAVARFNAAARAYVALAQAHPQLYGLMFGSAGRACLAAEEALTGPTPGVLLGRVLDELVDAGAVSPERRLGAEIHVWSAMHGFASLAQVGPLAELSPLARADVQEALLRFVIAGLRS